MGEIPVMVGPGRNVNPDALIVPPGVVTWIFPDAAPAGTTAESSPGPMTRKLAAGTPPKLTAVVPVKKLPLISTVAPAPALVGAKLEIVGGAIKVKPPRVPGPPGPVTTTFPLALPAATTAFIWVGETIIKLAAGTPPKLTAVVPVKFVPVIMTIAPAAALEGVRSTGFGGKR